MEHKCAAAFSQNIVFFCVCVRPVEVLLVLLGRVFGHVHALYVILNCEGNKRTKEYLRGLFSSTMEDRPVTAETLGGLQPGASLQS